MIIVGGLPAPVGGVTSYISRLVHLVPELFSEIIDLYPDDNKHGAPPGVILTQYPGPFSIEFVIRLFREKGTLHCNFSTLRSVFLFLCIIKPKRSRWILTLHNGSLGEKGWGTNWKNWGRRKLAELALSKFDNIIAISSTQKSFYESLKVDKKKIVILPTYVPLQSSFNEASPKLVKYQDFVSDHPGYLNILMNGYGTSIYRFEDLISFVQSNDGYTLTIALYGHIDGSYIAYLRKLSEGLPIFFVFSLSQEEFSYILKDCDIYVRANSVDSFGIVVADAVVNGKHVIATDVCSRFPGAYLYRCGDSSALWSLIRRYHNRRDSNYKEAFEFLNIDSDGTFKDGLKKRYHEVYFS